MPAQGRGAFILFEGVDKCGKTTQSRALVDHLNSAEVGSQAVRVLSFLSECRCGTRHAPPSYDTEVVSGAKLHAGSVYLPAKASQPASHTHTRLTTCAGARQPSGPGRAHQVPQPRRRQHGAPH